MKLHQYGTKSYWKAKTHPCDFISKCGSLVLYSLLTVPQSFAPLQTEAIQKSYVAANNRHIFRETLPLDVLLAVSHLSFMMCIVI